MKNKHAVALGRRGGRAGRGKSKARTSEQARTAVEVRWAKWRQALNAENIGALELGAPPITETQIARLHAKAKAIFNPEEAPLG